MARANGWLTDYIVSDFARRSNWATNSKCNSSKILIDQRFGIVDHN